MYAYLLANFISACSVSELHYSTDSLVITCYCVYMRVFGTNTSAGTWPSGPSALWAFTYFFERGVCLDHEVF